MKAVTVVLGLMLALVLTLAAFGLPIGASLKLLAEGAVMDSQGWSRTLVKMTPLLLAGLGMVVAWRAGMYNIGGEGQFIVGALVGAWVAKLFAGSVPGGVLNPLILVGSVLGGAVYAAIAGWLQVARGVQCVISTILLNFVAIQMLGWAVSGPLRRTDGTLPQTQPLPESSMLLRFDRQLDVHTGVLYALFASVVVTLYLYGTKGGYRLRITGANASVARANRIPASRVAVLSMALSGALCGLAGGVEYTGITGILGLGFPQGWGFLAIPVALLGGLHPLGVVLSALYFGALFAGSENLARFNTGGSTLVYVIQAVAVLAIVGLQQVQFRRRKVAA